MIGARGFDFCDLPDFDPTTPMGQMVLTMMAMADALAGAGNLYSTDVPRKEGRGGQVSGAVSNITALLEAGHRVTR